MKKILLLGGSGYIGSKFYENFVSKYSIQSIDLQLFSHAPYSICLNYNEIESISDYDIIVCLAAHSSVQMCEYSPERSWINNVDYFNNLCRKLTDNQKLIYMSSASIYGNTDKIVTEENSTNSTPIQNYDLHKIILDIIANKYIAQGKNLIGLRLGTVNGASPHTRKELMLNSMATNAIEQGCISIKNLSMKRSILGINDLMRALDIMLSQDIESGQYNLCSFTMNVKQLADVVASICGSSINEHQSDKIFYSFEMSTEKFCNLYGFEFKDTAESIVKNLINNHSHTIYSIRNNDGNFSKYL